MLPSRTFIRLAHSGFTPSPNTGYTTHFVRPNPDFVGTSYSPIPLGEGAIYKYEEW